MGHTDPRAMAEGEIRHVVAGQNEKMERNVRFVQAHFFRTNPQLTVPRL